MFASPTIIISLFAIASASISPYSDRGNRELQGRAMTWSGWLPGGGMTAFASSADDLWSHSGLRPPTSSNWQDSGNYWKNAHDPIERKLFVDSAADSTTLKPFDDSDDTFKLPRRPFDDERERRRSNERPYLHRSRGGYGEDDSNDDIDDRRRSGSNANASFNAWFPIMFGMYPSSENGGGRSTRNGNYGAGEEEGRGLAAVANSVNHGRSGVASSHAVINTGQPRYGNNQQRTY